MKTANQKLFDSLIRHQTYLLRFSGGLRNKVLELLRESNTKIIDMAVARLGGLQGIESAGDWRKLELTVKAIEKERLAVWAKANKLMASELKTLSRREIDFTLRQIDDALPVIVNLKKPKLANVDTLLARPVKGKTQSQWLATQRNSDITRIKSSLIGSVSNQTPIKQSLRAALKTTANNVDATAKTLVNNTATIARVETFKENDEIEQEIFIAVLDDRTTLICADNDGKLYVKGRGPIPPLHIGCRSIRGGVIGRALLRDRALKPSTERELVADYARENNLGNITSRKDLPFGHKGKFDEYAPQRVAGLIGDPVKRISYNDWLRTQDKAFIVDTLGPTRASLFMEGNLSLDKFVSRSGDSLTLDQIADRYPDIFRGLKP